MLTLAFDVYGTLIDTRGVVIQLQHMIGEQAEQFSRCWRDKQLEYSFRRGLMQDYQPFSRCTLDALQYTDSLLGTGLSQAQQQDLMLAYTQLPAFTDAGPALMALQQAGHRLYAFSNGQADAVTKLLQQAGIHTYFEAVISVVDVRSFKPSPDVYQHFLHRSHSHRQHTWLISGNPFDITGARHAGWYAAWIQRDLTVPFDPWDQQPDLTLPGLEALVTGLPKR